MSARKRYLTATEIATMIRADLKAAFPATKFSVRKDRSGSIRIEWTDGPTTSRVDEIVSAYDGKGFDGMIDLAYYIEGWWKDGKIVGTRCTGTVGSMGTVSPWGLEPPVEGAELVGLMGGYHSCRRHISPALANRCIAQIAEYWGGVTELPVAVAELPSKWDPKPTGHKLTPDGIGNRAPRKDLEGSGPWFSWHDMIHQAARDRTRFQREELPILVEDPPLSAEIAELASQADGLLEPAAIKLPVPFLRLVN